MKLHYVCLVEEEVQKTVRPDGQTDSLNSLWSSAGLPGTHTYTRTHTYTHINTHMNTCTLMYTDTLIQIV